ncbi:MAG TPA: MaoC family dehydratase N-terminal domain-containing protein, partial [Streptosporangiaceae bacterium]
MAGEVATDTDGRIREQAERIMALGESSPRLARDPVNLPIIENWVEAIGDPNPVYTDPDYAASSVHGGLVAPPMMAQVWTMVGLGRVREAGDPTGVMVTMLDEAGYTGVVATNSDHVFHRYLRHGEQLSVTVSLIGL